MRLKPLIKPALGVLLVVVCAFAVWLLMASSGWLGSDEIDGRMSTTPRSPGVLAEIAEDQATTARSLGADDTKQILFGDFHVHTTFSFDAFLMGLPIAGGAGTRPPSDACDFARHCSQLDFWSINDHAENLTPRLWKQTIDSVRECNALAGDATNPDLVTFLGWEWSQIGDRPDNHYGHKNVVLRGLSDQEITTRPIGSQDTSNLTILPWVARAALSTFAGPRGRDFVRFLGEVASTPACPRGVAVRDLPPDCMEAAPTPELLFDKLDDWGVPSIVIPHGTAWGIYTPAGSDWRKQLPTHDPERQTLLEVYSGHGSSEQLPPWRAVDIGEDGSFSCPPPSGDYLPSCWRAGELLRERCLEVGEDEDECAARAVLARQNYVDAFQAGWKTLPGHETGSWRNAGQAPDEMFQPAFNYRPLGSAQYMLAIRDFEDPDNPKRFEFGFIGSSDNHTARPGTGYKEIGRGEMTEGRGSTSDDGPGAAGGGIFGSDDDVDEPVAESIPYTERGGNPLSLFEIERGSAYFFTGGLVAVHSEGRSREQIWDAIERKEVYATSGRRTLLWFDLVEDDGTVPMGATVERSDAPRFRVRAAGSFEQKPGCPPDAAAALGDRVDHLCMGECYNPGDERRPLRRIEIVRVRPQNHADEPLDDLVEDPWRVFPCPAGESGCVAEFTDEEFPGAGRDTVYYARAIEASAPLIHGRNPLNCSWDASGNCIEIDPCGANAPASDDCLSLAEPRAWSSPIYVDYVAGAVPEKTTPSPPT